MKQLVVLGVAVLLSTAQAATTYVKNGVTFVNLEEFAKENGIFVQNNVGEITLIKGGTRVYVADNPMKSTVNGEITPFQAGATNIMGNIAVPLLDIQKAFGLKVPKVAGQMPIQVSTQVPALTSPKPNISTTPTAATAASTSIGGVEIEIIRLNSNLGMSRFKGMEGSDYIKLTAPPKPTPYVMTEYCLEATREQLIHKDSLIVDTLELVIYKDSGYILRGSGLVKNNGGAQAPYTFTCYAKILQNTLYITAN